MLGHASVALPKRAPPTASDVTAEKEGVICIYFVRNKRIIGGATAPRQDAANVNNWHWSEEDLAPWAKERLTELIVGTAASGVPDKGWVKITKLDKCEGEASVSNRKGKRIIAFELKVTFKWEGSVDYDEVQGELILPYVSEVRARHERVPSPFFPTRAFSFF